MDVCTGPQNCSEIALLVACKSRRTLFCCRVSDQVDRRLLLAVSAAVLVATDLLLATATGAASLIGRTVLWGA